MKEISVLSLICSCLYPETRKNIMGDFEGTFSSDWRLQFSSSLSNILESKKSHTESFLSFSLLHAHADMDIKPINKRASGQAFEVILKPSSPVSDVAHCVTSPPKRDLSLEDIQKKLEAAEDRRRVRMIPIIFITPSCHLWLCFIKYQESPKGCSKSFCDTKTKGEFNLANNIIGVL